MKGKQVTQDADLIDAKANELIDLLKKQTVDARQAKALRKKLNTALDKIAPAPTAKDTAKSDLELLLSGHQLHKAPVKYRYDFELYKKYLLIIIGVIMVTLGMAMIIMPAPPYFEMFTIFHFNANDGVTLMDLIALAIVFTGIYLPLNALSKKIPS